MPAAKHDPRALNLAWELKDGFELVFVEPTAGARTKRKQIGQVVTWRDTEKGKVDNKQDQVLCLLTCSTQGVDAPPYALQVKKLDYSKLSIGLLKDVKKGLSATSTLIQTSRKSSSTRDCVVPSCCVVCVHRTTEGCAQEMAGC